MIGIKQAVILAGGRGERLRPITDTIPKPMVPINGRPFLEYLVELLKDNGIQEVVMLLGYLPNKIIEHFGDGSKFGIKIKYSITLVEDETGTRIKKVRDLLSEIFLLLYCDNYWPLDLAKLEKFFAEKNALVSVTVYANKDGFMKNNISVDEDGLVRKYDHSRSAEGLNGVDIGFFILDKKILNLMPGENFSFEKVILPKLIENQKLSGYLTNYPYTSIGSTDRLPRAAKFLERRKIIFLDRDGTINERPEKARYIMKWGDFKFLPGVIEAIKMLAASGYEIYVITNQSGIGRGVMTLEDLENIHTRLKSELFKSGAQINGIYFCPHDWDEGCSCRKPNIGLFLRAARENCLDLSKTIFIGDDERDLTTGNKAGITTFLVDANKNLLDIVKEKILV